MSLVKSGFNRAKGSLASLEKEIFLDKKSLSNGIQEDVDPVFLLELGIGYFYKGKFAESNRVLEEAFHFYEEQENRAKISLSEIFKEAAESSLTEGLGDYQLVNYEKILLHSIKALNFLMLGNPSRARVEIERSYIRQKNILEKSERELAELKHGYEEKLDSVFDRVQSESKLSDSKISKYKDTLSVEKLLNQVGLNQGEKKMVQKVRSSYENAFTEVLSSLTFKLNGEWGNSLPPLKRAINITDNWFVKRAKGITESKTSLKDDDNFYLFVFKDFAPEKVSRSITFGNPFTGAINRVSIARVIPRISKESKIRVLGSGNTKGNQPAPLTNINILALKQYEEELPYLAAKATMRLATQFVKDYYLQKELGQGGTLLASILNLAVERADVRTWSLLPGKIYFLSGKYNSKTIDFSATISGKKIPINGPIRLVENKVTVAFIRVFDNDVKLYYHNFSAR